MKGPLTVECRKLTQQGTPNIYGQMPCFVVVLVVLKGNFLCFLHATQL